MNDLDKNSSPKIDGVGYLSEIIKSVTGQIEGVKSDSPVSAEPERASNTPQSDLISSLLSSPELLAALPKLISTAKPIIDLLGGLNRSEPQAVGASAGNRSEVGESRPEKSLQSHDRRSALLCAMKPYLSHDRQQAIDYIIKLGRLGDILKTL